MEWETMKLDGEDPVRHLVFNRPAVHNAVNRQFLLDVAQACGYVESLPDCRALIVRGAGPSFCSGADLKENLTGPGALRAVMRRSKSGTRAVQALGDVTPITIAAIHGNAIGGGAMLAMACDFRIAGAGARLSVREVSVREVSLGLSLSWQSIPNVVNLTGPSKAKEMILFGETYDARTMLDYGVYDQVVPDDKLLDAARALAEKVVAQPPLAVAMTKASINAYVRAMDRAVFHADPIGLTLTGRSKDAAAAKEAFFSGQRAHWQEE